MNVLLTYPQYPASFFSFTYALEFISKKASLPPLGLITISAMLPAFWQRRLVDLNIAPLQDRDLEWADYVFISAMYIQKESVSKIIEACVRHQVKIVAGGPLFTHEFSSYPQIDHFVLNEAEITLPPFLNELASGKLPRKVYRSEKFADISMSPLPEYHLLSRKDYASLNIQFSRGCPYSCDFCEIPSMLGRKVRIKKPDQILRELDALYQLNWRGSISIVDDNFIGNKQEIKNHVLPEIKEWMQEHDYPFIFNVQTSIDLSDDPELMSLMIESGINMTFIGIETPSEKSLQECNKHLNKNRNLLQNVTAIQKAGMQVSGGFILGFDSDSPSIFQEQIDFIQQSGIVWAMVGLLNAPKNTPLYKRLAKEKRLTTQLTGNNTDYSMNFIPEMGTENLLSGYHSIIQNIYSVKPYYKRIRQFLLNYSRVNNKQLKIDRYYISAFFKSILIIGVLKKGRGEYWKLLGWTLLHRPNLFLYAIMYAICGYHFRRVYELGDRLNS